jgi:hypothetical protein
MYRYINPWYLKAVIPKVFPVWTKNFTVWKKAFASTAVDIGVFSVAIMGSSMAFESMLFNKGDISKTIEKVYNDLPPTLERSTHIAATK